MTTAREFIHRQLGTAGWAPINHEMAVLLCREVVNEHRAFAVDQHAPENLLRAFPGTRLYQAQVDGIGVVFVLSRSSLILAERMQFLGFAVTKVTEFNARAPAAHVVPKPEPRTNDPLALLHAGVATKEPPRPCKTCGRMSSSQTCLAALLGEIEGRPRDYRPDISHPRRCLAYAPPYGTSDDRTGRELWPEIGEQNLLKPVILKAESKLEGDSSAIERARALLTAMLKDGPRDAAEIFTAAEGDNIGERTIQRAAEALGVVKTKAGFSGGWTWAMPETEDIAQTTR